MAERGHGTNHQAPNDGVFGGGAGAGLQRPEPGALTIRKYGYTLSFDLNDPADQAALRQMEQEAAAAQLVWDHLAKFVAEKLDPLLAAYEALPSETKQLLQEEAKRGSSGRTVDSPGG